VAQRLHWARRYEREALVVGTETPVVRVLVVDDSPVSGEQTLRILQTHDLVSSKAVGSLMAARQIELDRPDVILLSLPTSRMDGLSLLRKLLAKDPIPTVVCSDLSVAGADLALRALDEGAVEAVARPRWGASGAIVEESVTPLVDALRAAVHATVGCRPSAVRRARGAKRPQERSRGGGAADRLIAVGASMGGPEALATFLGALPEDAPGVVVVQHMPEAFTSVLARRLHAVCRIVVREAVDGDLLEQGQALIAPGNRHLVVGRDGVRWRVRLVDGPLISRHRPSVDVLFRSVAQAAGRRAFGVLLSGMGRDGAEGLLAMKARGAWTIAQDEASCVVFGMPREAIAAGAVDAVLPLSQIAPAILDRAAGASEASGA